MLDDNLGGEAALILASPGGAADPTAETATSTCLTGRAVYDTVATSVMSELDLRSRIKEMLVKNLMLQTTAEQIGDDLPLFGPNGLGLDSIDALELAVSMEKTFGVGVPNSEVAGKALKTVNTIHDYILEKREATG
ncbi:MAG: acyl carrier protein [Verrucomicrobiota bacterium]